MKTQISEKEKLSWLRLYRTENIGTVNFFRLIEKFGTAEEAIYNLPEFSRQKKRPIDPYPLELAEQEYNSLKKLNGEIITSSDSLYPYNLANIDDKPPIISFIGNIEIANKPSIAIVGARNSSLNGNKFAKRLANELGNKGQIIVSGLARGIDTAAHEGSIETGTIAVLAGGVNIAYPPQNNNLYNRIIENGGLIIAESPLSTQPIARHFPKRNRIVSGLSSATIVIEATLRSGSLITARMAAEQGRDVYAVPGFPTDPRAQGPNKLIRDGAILIQSADDVIESLTPISRKQMTFFEEVEYNFSPVDIVEKQTEKQELDICKLIENNLSSVSVSVDELARTCQLTISELQAPLLEMELTGKIQRLPGNKICLAA